MSDKHYDHCLFNSVIAEYNYKHSSLSYGTLIVAFIFLTNWILIAAISLSYLISTKQFQTHKHKKILTAETNKLIQFNSIIPPYKHRTAKHNISLANYNRAKPSKIQHDSRSADRRKAPIRTRRTKNRQHVQPRFLMHIHNSHSPHLERYLRGRPRKEVRPERLRHGNNSRTSLSEKSNDLPRWSNIEWVEQSGSHETVHQKPKKKKREQEWSVAPHDGRVSTGQTERASSSRRPQFLFWAPSRNFLRFLKRTSTFDCWLSFLGCPRVVSRRLLPFRGRLQAVCYFAVTNQRILNVIRICSLCSKIAFCIPNSAFCKSNSTFF